MARNTAQTIEKSPAATRARRTTTRKLEQAPRSNRGRKAEAIKEFIPPTTTAKRYRTRKDYVGEGWKATVDEAKPSLSKRVAAKFEATETAIKAKEAVKQEKPESPQLTITNELSGPTDQTLAYNIAEMCNKYVFLMKDIFGGQGGIAEIDIHIKVKPVSVS